jgi:muconolactone D-isomerase
VAEYLVRIVLERPAGVGDEDWSALLDRESEVGLDYRRRGIIQRIWRVPGTTSNVGLWHAADATELDGLIRGLPAFRHMAVGVEPLALHYLEADV